MKLLSGSLGLCLIGYAVPPKRDRCILAAEATQAAQELPDGAAISVATRVGKEKHLVYLLFEFVSRGHENCNRIVINLQAVNIGTASNRGSRGKRKDENGFKGSGCE